MFPDYRLFIMTKYKEPSRWNGSRLSAGQASGLIQDSSLLSDILQTSFFTTFKGKVSNQNAAIKQKICCFRPKKSPPKKLFCPAPHKTRYYCYQYTVMTNKINNFIQIGKKPT